MTQWIFLDNNVLKSFIAASGTYGTTPATMNETDALRLLNYLEQAGYQIGITDVVEDEAVNNLNYNADRIVQEFIQSNGIQTITTTTGRSGAIGGDAGERSIVDAVNQAKAAGDQYIVASDDLTFDWSTNGIGVGDRVGTVRLLNQLRDRSILSEVDYAKYRDGTTIFGTKCSWCVQFIH